MEALACCHLVAMYDTKFCSPLESSVAMETCREDQLVMGIHRDYPWKMTILIMLTMLFVCLLIYFHLLSRRDNVQCFSMPLITHKTHTYNFTVQSATYDGCKVLSCLTTIQM